MSRLVTARSFILKNSKMAGPNRSMPLRMGSGTSGPDPPDLNNIPEFCDRNGAPNTLR